jgi:hypothetical protein
MSKIIRFRKILLNTVSFEDLIFSFVESIFFLQGYDSLRKNAFNSGSDISVEIGIFIFGTAAS